MMEGVGIYRIVSPSGACYVGMTRDSFSNRWKGHLKDLRQGRHKCRALARAYSKYGEEALSFEILETVPKDSSLTSVLKLEQKWWDYLTAKGERLYNGRPSGTGGVHHTDETKLKIRNSQKPAPKAQAACGFCHMQFYFLVRRPRKFCSVKCSQRAPRPKTGLQTKVSKEQLIMLAALNFYVKDMAQAFQCSPQRVCDLHRFYGLKTPKQPRRKTS